MTNQALIAACLVGDKYYQHYLTKVDRFGRVQLGQFCHLEDGPQYHWDRWITIEGYCVTGQSEWFAIRPEHQQSMSLCRLDSGSSDLVEVNDPEPLVDAFRWLFAEGGGFDLRPSEQALLDAENDDIDSTRLAALAGL